METHRLHGGCVDPVGPRARQVVIPSPPDLLALWEWGQGRGPACRALAVAALGGENLAAAAGQLPLPELDRQILRLHGQVFGASTEMVGRCPACSQPLELDLDVEAALGQMPPAPDALSADHGIVTNQGEGTTLPHVEVEVDGWSLRARPVLGDDLLALETARPADPVRFLFQRCVTSARRAGEAGDARAEALPAAAMNAVAVRLGELQESASIRMSLRCPGCAHVWSEGLDPAQVFWASLEIWAEQALRAVHALARAYGWREQDVLALGSLRRKRYLELAGA